MTMDLKLMSMLWVVGVVVCLGSMCRVGAQLGISGYKPLELSGQSVRILVNEDLSLDIQDVRGTSLWNGRDTYAPHVFIGKGESDPRRLALSSAGQRSVEPFSDGRHQGYKITLSRFAESDVELALILGLDAQMDELLVEIAQTGGRDVATRVEHLYHFEQPMAEGGYLVVSHGAGYLFTPDISSKLEGQGLIGTRYSLPLFGLKQGNHGMYAIVESWHDCLVDYAHLPGEKWELDFHWVAAEGGLTYPRRLLLRFGEGLDYVKMAKGYRQYARDQGLLRTLEQKAQKLPLLRRYLDGIEFRWTSWEPTQVEAVKADLRRLRDLGVKLNFFYPKQPGGAQLSCWMLEDPIPGGWPAMVELADYTRDLGFPIKCFINGLSLPSPGAPQALREALDHAASRRLKPDALYFDCYTAHGANTLPPDRREHAADIIACFQETARRGIIPGSELPRFWAMAESCFYSFDGTWSSDRLSVGEPIPLLQLVFHDCYFAHFSGGGYGGGVDWWPDRNPRLYELLFATAPSYNWLPNGKVPVEWDDPATMKRWQWLRLWSAYFRFIATSEMVSHEFLSADRKQQRITFANGAVAEFDMAVNRFRVWGVPRFNGKWIAAPEITAPEGSLTWTP